jgi:hypothetical protein
MRHEITLVHPKADMRFTLECSCGQEVFDSEGRMSVPWNETVLTVSEHLKPQLAEDMKTLLRQVSVRDILREVMRLRKKEER